jgi:hypothetical protein
LRLQSERERISSAPEADRAALVAKTLEFFDVDARGLTKDQQFGIATDQIDARMERFRIIALVVVTLAVIGAVTSVSMFAIARIAAVKNSATSSSNGGLDPAVAGELPNEVVFSGSDTKVGHRQKKAISFGSGSLVVAISPTGSQAYLQFCMSQPDSNNRACSSTIGPVTSGKKKIPFDINDYKDWHFTKGGEVFFKACAYRSVVNGSLTSQIRCSDPHKNETREQSRSEDSPAR